LFYMTVKPKTNGTQMTVSRVLPILTTLFHSFLGYFRQMTDCDINATPSPFISGHNNNTV